MRFDDDFCVPKDVCSEICICYNSTKTLKNLNFNLCEVTIDYLYLFYIYLKKMEYSCLSKKRASYKIIDLKTINIFYINFG